MIKGTHGKGEKLKGRFSNNLHNFTSATFLGYSQFSKDKYGPVTFLVFHSFTWEIIITLRKRVQSSKN